jgi:hypothetical protein
MTTKIFECNECQARGALSGTWGDVWGKAA